MSRCVAIVEDEAAIRENYVALLTQHGYQVQAFADRQSAMQAFEEKLPDLAVIDIGLAHEMDGGFLLCQALRAMSSTLPIIFLTARDNDIDTVCGLRMGADDYLSKDISLPHMMARISALFRRIELTRQSQPQQQETLLTAGDLSVQVDRMLVYWQEQLLDLTVTEFWLLYALIKVPGHVKNREQLMQEAKVFVDDSTITSHIKRIRKKFIAIDAAFDRIDTVYGMGYRWKVA